MKKEVFCCDSCDKFLTAGALRMTTGGGSAETIDLCPECLADVLPDYSDQTGSDFLTVEISQEDFLVLMGDDGEEEIEEDSGEVMEQGFASV